MKSIHILWNTLLNRNVSIDTSIWGAFMICGFQGSGKTAFAVLWTSRYYKNLKIKTNIHSLNIPGRDISYFTKLEDVYSDTDTDMVYIIDEVSKKFTKTSKTDKDFYAWLQQCRKRRRIVFLIMQEFKECPTWLRRPLKFYFTTQRKFGLFYTTCHDIQNAVLDDNYEWTAPILSRYIYKFSKKYASYYDTFEPIEDL